MKTYEPHVSSLGGLAANLVSCLAYVAALLGGGPLFIVLVVVFFVEKNSRLVRFSIAQGVLLMAFQSVLRGIINGVGGTSFSWLGMGLIRSILSVSQSIIWGLASVAVILVFLVLIIRCAVAAYHWQELQVPFVGKLAGQLVDSFDAVAYDGDGPVPPDCAVQNESYPGPGGPQEGGGDGV